MKVRSPLLAVALLVAMAWWGSAPVQAEEKDRLTKCK
jgi:hypothetical protein